MNKSQVGDLEEKKSYKMRTKGTKEEQEIKGTKEEQEIKATKRLTKVTK
jgi:hypothetical protein